MCSHYQAVKERERYLRQFHVLPPDDGGKEDVWPGCLASAIRRAGHSHVADDGPASRESFLAQFGLIPHWATDATGARNTFHARSETVASKPSFRDAYKRGQRCIIPAEAFFEPDWRSGKAVATRISCADGEPLGIAGLWSAWKTPTGELVHSFAVLTISAEQHALMKSIRKPTDETRMVVILPQERYQDWLQVPLEHCAEFMQPYPAERLSAQAALPPAELMKTQLKSQRAFLLS